MRASVLGLGLAASALLLLTACTGQATAGPSTAPTGGAAATATSTPTPVVTPSPTAQPLVSKPIARTCGQLVSQQVMYDYNPNFALLPKATTQPGTPQGDLAAAKGVVCQWQNTSSNDLLTVAVVSLSDAQLTTQKNAAYSGSELVPTYDVEGYFSLAGREGRAIAFDRGYEVVSASTYYAEPGDAQPIIAATLAALP